MKYCSTFILALVIYALAGQLYPDSRYAFWALADAENGLSDRFRRLLHGLWGDLRSLDDRMAELDREIALIAQSDPVAKRLEQLRGVGPVIATALVAAVGGKERGCWGSASVATPICGPC